MGLQGDSLNLVVVTAIYASTLVVLRFTSGAVEQRLCDVCVEANAAEACKNGLLAFSSVSHYQSHCGGRYIMCVCVANTTGVDVCVLDQHSCCLSHQLCCCKASWDDPEEPG